MTIQLFALLSLSTCVEWCVVDAVYNELLSNYAIILAFFLNKRYIIIKLRISRFIRIGLSALFLSLLVSERSAFMFVLYIIEVLATTCNKAASCRVPALFQTKTVEMLRKNNWIRIIKS